MNRIPSIYAYLATDKGVEGIAGAFVPGMGWVALVSADRAGMDKFQPLVKGLAKLPGAEIRLVEFVVRNDLEVVKP